MIKWSIRKKAFIYVTTMFFIALVVMPAIYANPSNETTFSSEQNKILVEYKEKEYRIVTLFGEVKYKAYVWVYQISDDNDENYDTYEIIMRLQRIYVTNGCNTIEMLVNVTNKVHPFDSSRVIPYAFFIRAAPDPGDYKQIADIPLRANYDPPSISLIVNLFGTHISTTENYNLHSFTSTKLSVGISALGPDRDGKWVVIFKHPDSSHDGSQDAKHVKIDGQVDTIFYIEGIMYNRNNKVHYVGQFTIVCSLKDLV
ncbi:MAG: hypothetical protein ACP6IS_08265 [Candidatus Asgardarchaeia archaeon]